MASKTKTPTKKAAPAKAAAKTKAPAKAPAKAAVVVKATTPKELAKSIDARRAPIALRTVTARAASHRKSREATRVARDTLDQAMLSARQNGATYRDIAVAAGVSTAWVQASLERAGYKTDPR